MKKIKYELSINKYSIIYALHLMLAVYIWIMKRWVFGGKISNYIEYCVVLMCLSGSLACFVIRPIDKLKNMIGITIKQKACIFCLALYSGFASIGYRTFFKEVSFIGICKVICFGIWVYPLLFLLLWVILKVRERNQSGMRYQYDKYWGWKCFFSLVILWSILYVGTWPGVIPYDGNVEIDVAMGMKPFTSWQPYIHVFFVYIALKVFGHIYGFFLMHIIFLAALLSGMLFYFHKNRGVNTKMLYIVMTALAICPRIFTSAMVLLRDPVFSYAMAWLVFLLLIYREENKTGYYIQLFAAFFLVATMRSNGIVPFIFTFIFFLIKGIKKDRKLLVISLSVLVLYIFINGPLANFLNVQKEKRVTFVSQTAIDAFMSIKHYGGDLPQEVEEFMQKVTLIENADWASQYDEQRFNMQYDVADVPSSYIIKLYIETLIKNPHMVIWNRLSKCSHLWEIFGHGEGYIKEYIFTSYINENTAYPNCYYPLMYNDITPITQWIYKIFTQLGTDFILYRSGLYVVIIILLIIVSTIRERRKMLTALIPAASNFAAMVYGIGYNEGRFVYWLIFCGIIVLLNYTFCEQNVYTEMKGRCADGE